jgi:prepilin-type N-terminal cleavage/methylation domain-containing protein
MYGKKGFSLIEIIVVLGMLGVLFALSLPISSRFSSVLYLNASAKALASELRNVQNQSILQHKTLSLDLANLNLPPGIHLANNRDITFSPSGFPPPGKSGTLVLQNSLGRTKKVIVSSVGRVRIE